MSILSSYSDLISGLSITFSSTIHEKPSIPILHNHIDQYEILVFIRGNATFHVEGATYVPLPWSIVITCPYEMHQMCVDPHVEYTRYVISIPTAFFAKYDCNMFMDIFHDRTFGVNNLIKSNLRIREILDSISDCIDKGAPDVVIRSMFIQLLYNIYLSMQSQSVQPIAYEYSRDLLLYINNNLSSNLSLEHLSKHFSLSKNYLCTIFKKSTGYTIGRYITYKRLLKAREYYVGGMSLLEASEEAGFGNYSTFYKMYKNEFGVSPRKRDLTAQPPDNDSP